MLQDWLSRLDSPTNWGRSWLMSFELASHFFMLVVMGSTFSISLCRMEMLATYCRGFLKLVTTPLLVILDSLLMIMSASTCERRASFQENVIQGRRQSNHQVFRLKCLLCSRFFSARRKGLVIGISEDSISMYDTAEIIDSPKRTRLTKIISV